MTGDLTETLTAVLGEHAYVPSGLRGVSRCACGLACHGMPHEHRAHVAAVLTALVAAEREKAVREAADEWEQEDTDALGDWLRDYADRMHAAATEGGER